MRNVHAPPRGWTISVWLARLGLLAGVIGSASGCALLLFLVFFEGVECPYCGLAPVIGLSVAAVGCVLASELADRLRRGLRWVSVFGNLLSLLVWLALWAGVTDMLGLGNKDWARQSSALNDIGRVRYAEHGYEGTSGCYVPLACLVRPGTCMAKDGPATPSFLEEEFLVEERHHYRFQFHPGPPAGSPTGNGAEQCLESYAYTAVPAVDESRYRSFCTDSRGVSCMARTAKRLLVVGGLCSVDGRGPGPGGCAVLGQ